MNQKQVVTGLVLTMLLQLALLGGMLASAAMPLWTGTEIRVKTIPVDPRSLFRGNYARLEYEFSTLPKDALDTSELRENEPIYVSLQPDLNEFYTFAGASTSKPEHGIYLRGRIKGARSTRVRYGIEAWFAPKARALQLEKDLRDGGVAVLMVTATGKAALAEVLPLE